METTNIDHEYGQGNHQLENGGMLSSPPQDPLECSIDEDVNSEKFMVDEAMLKIMSECSLTAQEMREAINTALEARGPVVADPEKSEASSKVEVKCPSTKDELKQFLTDNLKEKIADLEMALKNASTTPETGNDPNVGSTKPANCIIQPSNQEEKNDCGCSNSKEPCPEDPSVLLIPKPKIPKDNENKLKKLPKSNSTIKKSGQKEKSTTEYLMKSLSSCETDSEKLNRLCKKYIELLEENKTLEQNSKQQEKICVQIIKEKEQLQEQHNKTVLAKSRLEGLCRELQRHNKVVKDESLLRIKEEEERRREIANKFQATLTDIMQLVQENQHRNTLLKEENSELAQKLKTLMDHYEKWEKNIEKIIQQKDLETQLTKAKLAKSNFILNQEKEQFLNEKQQLVTMISGLQKRSNELLTNELHLRAELGVYTSRYEEFQSVLTKSNDMFNSFKKDMEKMSKQIKRLEKETTQWKQKWENSNKALANLSGEVNFSFVSKYINVCFFSETKERR